MNTSRKRKQAAKRRGIGEAQAGLYRHGDAKHSEPIDEAIRAPKSAPEDRDAVLADKPAIRVAILSFLFNWPSTGGGIVHTVELADFLGRAGYSVRHFYARNPSWGIGRVTQHVPFDSYALDFDDRSFHAEAIQERFRRTVAEFDPDYVIITDSWNFKPLLAEAVSPFPYFLRLQASECLCPLNNLRFLPGGGQCPNHQLANAERCRGCIERFAGDSGGLHQAERTLAGVGTPRYEQTLRRAFAEAEAVLVVNELAATMIGPYARAVRVVTSGFDPARFDESGTDEQSVHAGSGKLTIFMAGVVEDGIKGFHVLDEACRKLWQTRQDFELLATGDPPGQINAYTRFVGWQPQERLPSYVRAADIVVVPTIAQDALGRTAVEAMAAGRPVAASRIGGLPYTLADGAGLLFEPGDAGDLARKLGLLLDDADLRRTLGALGRRRFEEHYTWQAVIDRHYRPLLSTRRRRGASPLPRDGANAPAAGDAVVSQSSKPPGTNGRPYAPFIPNKIDEGRLLQDLSRALGIENERVAEMLDAYRGFHCVKGYEYKLGELKTLCFEEAFILYATLWRYRPRTIVEIGAQHGKATRRLLDAAALLGLETRMIAFDVADQIEHFRPQEAELIIEDVTGRFRQCVLDRFEPQLLFVDVHRYALLAEILREATQWPGQLVTAIHDCGRGLCNPQMAISKDDPEVTSLTGTWERHVLAEQFGVDDPLSERLEDLATETHLLKILSTPHGLGLLIPRLEGASHFQSPAVAFARDQAASTPVFVSTLNH